VDDFPCPSWGRDVRFPGFPSHCQAGGAEEDGHDDGMVPNTATGGNEGMVEKTEQGRDRVEHSTVFLLMFFVCSLGTLFYRWYNYGITMTIE